MNRLAALSVAMLLSCVFAEPQPLRGEDLLVSPQQLAGMLGDPQLVILHAGSDQDYAEGHISGARLVNMADVATSHPGQLRVELPAWEDLRNVLEVRGISGDSRIVLYSGTSSFQSMTRIFFTLEYAGLRGRVSVLDGGIAAWQSEGRAVSTEAATPQRGSLSRQPDPSGVADAAWVAEHKDQPQYALIDARAPEYYSGREPGSASRAGHIPGARNLPFTSLVSEDGRFRSRAELGSLLESAGLAPGMTSVSYCHIGIQATAVYFAARLLGYDAKMYDGSFQDWSARAELPVARQNRD